jgi:hypothetical protein
MSDKPYRIPMRQNYPLMILKIELVRLVGTVLIAVGGNILNSIFPGVKTLCFVLAFVFFVAYGYFQNKEGLKGGLEHKIWRFGLSKTDKYNFDPTSDTNFHS